MTAPGAATYRVKHYSLEPTYGNGRTKARQLLRRSRQQKRRRHRVLVQRARFIRMP